MAAVKTLYISSFNWWFMWYFCSLKSTGCMHFIQEASFGRQWWQGGSSLLSYNTQAPMDHAINHVPNSIPKAQSRKKPTYLCAPRAFLKQLCRSCLIIIRSFYFDHRINLSHTRAAWSAFCTQYSLYQQINKFGKSNHMKTFNMETNRNFRADFLKCCLF